MKSKQLATCLVAGLVLSFFSCETIQDDLQPSTYDAQQSLDDCLLHSRSIQVSNDSIVLEASTLAGNAVYELSVICPNGIDSVWGIETLKITFEDRLPAQGELEIDLSGSEIFSDPSDGVSFSISDDGYTLELSILPASCSPTVGDGLWLRLVFYGQAHCEFTLSGGITIVIDDNF